MQETRNSDGWIRCKKCGHKLFRGGFGWQEIKCHSCKTVNEIGTQYDKLMFLLSKSGIPYMTMIHEDEGFRFQSVSVDLNNGEHMMFPIGAEFDADEEYKKIAEEYGFFVKEEVNA